MSVAAEDAWDQHQVVASLGRWTRSDRPATLSTPANGPGAALRGKVLLILHLIFLSFPSENDSGVILNEGLLEAVVSFCGCSRSVIHSRVPSSERRKVKGHLTTFLYSLIIFIFSSAALPSSFCSRLLIILQEARLAPMTFL